MGRRRTGRWRTAIAIGVLVWSGCGGEASGPVLVVDAEYDPDEVSNVSAPILEEPITEIPGAAAQIFTVLGDGKLERFWLVLTNGESVDEGTLRVTLRPVDGSGRPDPNPSSSIIDPIDVATELLPAHPIEDFMVFDVGDDPGREVRTGEQYAVVVEFVSRVPAGAASDRLPIARMLGRDGDGYPGGQASTSPDGVTWTHRAGEDYFFRTFILK